MQLSRIYIFHVISLSAFCFLGLFDMFHQLLISRMISPAGAMKETCHKTLAEMILLCL